MTDSNATELVVLADAEAVARAAADRTVALLAGRSGPLSLALSGGTTPQRYYRLLAAEPYRSRLPWQQIHVFVVDERHVSPDHADSNYRMMREALLERVPIPPSHLHPMATDGGPEDCATRYRGVLRDYFGDQPQRLDLVLLGMGADGHTASLFPGHPLETTESVVAVKNSPKPPPTRLTLTLPLLSQARQVWFLVTGADKAAALNRVLSEGVDGELPAGRVRPADGKLVWLVDQAARGMVEAG